jgi:hypothetical protein
MFLILVLTLLFPQFKKDVEPEEVIVDTAQVLNLLSVKNIDELEVCRSYMCILLMCTNTDFKS